MEYVSIADAAKILNVSIATIRNWIKLNILILKEDDPKLIEKSSIDNLVNNNYNGKLSSRRNKSKKSGKIQSINYLAEKENQIKLLELINNFSDVESKNEIRYILKKCATSLFIASNKYNDDAIKILDELYNGNDIDEYKDIKFDNFSLDEDYLGALYMCLLKISERKDEGMYFTPAYVVNSMFNNMSEITDLENKTVIDLCSGTGNFLIQALNYGFDPNNIYGSDNDCISVILARINMMLRTNLSYEKIVNNIMLSDSLMEDFGKFDFCIGNPPWGSSLVDYNQVKNLYTVAKAKSVDSFSLFIEKGLKLLNDGGYLYYVCPEALCNVGIHKETRIYLSRHSKLIYLDYLGNAFDGVQAPAITICVKKEQASDFGVGATINNGLETYVINNTRKTSSDYWNFNISNNYYKIIKKIEKNTNIVYLKDNAIFALGIVTGNNSLYVLNEKTEKANTLVKGSNVYKYKVEENAYYLEYNRNNFQQVAPDEIYFAKEKLIYRFISDTLVFAYDDSQVLTLNSANICIPTIKDLPLKYIMAILNSRLAHFIFKLKFNSVKVLRNHIESIPIIKPNYDDIVNVINYVDKINIVSNKMPLYDELDNYIMDLYGLTNDEKNIIKQFNKSNIFLN